MGKKRFPSFREIQQTSTPLSRVTWSGCAVETRLPTKGAKVAIHAGLGVFVTRCPLCGEVFVNPGASTRPANLVDHMFAEHSVYDGYHRPMFPV